MKTDEGNRLIAEFMGTDPYYTNLDEEHEEYVDANNDNLRYHKSWDHLMPVVKKIMNWLDGDEACYYYFMHRLPDCEILNTWEACVEFIGWYNEKK